ncbi:DUF4199 domain-containing protein [uncultured Psychroserpens sp.]|uniref:DUF4199 domain-containing protein n=1 Tax=uncultured Psychroserpens sp. TaxID=255436 RepID=UPI002619A3B9|nr:DUF4199 domain-containing protein [uncultured Psychroserpens sp.]
MKNTIIKYGIYAFITASVLFLSGFLIGKQIDLDFNTMAIFGYASMVLSLLFVYFGIKHFRDHVNDGKINLGKAIAIGLLISLFAAIGFAIVDYIYTTSINPNFAAEYKDYSMAQLQEANLSAEVLKEKTEQLETSMAMMGSSTALAFIMFATVMIIGFIISLISGLILQRK